MTSLRLSEGRRQCLWMQTGRKDLAPGAARSGSGLGRGDRRLACAGGFSPSMGSTVIWPLGFLALFGVGGRLHARSATR